MRNRMYGGVRGRKMKVGRKLLRFPPTRFFQSYTKNYIFRKFRPHDHRCVHHAIVQYFRWWSKLFLSTTHRPPNCESISAMLISIRMSLRNKIDLYSFDNVLPSCAKCLAKVRDFNYISVFKLNNSLSTCLFEPFCIVNSLAGSIYTSFWYV